MMTFEAMKKDIVYITGTVLNAIDNEIMDHDYLITDSPGDADLILVADSQPLSNYIYLSHKGKAKFMYLHDFLKDLRSPRVKLMTFEKLYKEIM